MAEGLWMIVTAVLVLVLSGVMIGAGSTVLNDFMSSQGAGTAAYNNTNLSLFSIGKLAQSQTTVVSVVVASIIISVLAGAFMVYRYVA